MHKRTLGEKLFDCSNMIIMMILMLATVYPFLHVVFASFSNSNLLMAHSGLLYGPLEFNVKAYEAVAKNPNILSGYMNTLTVVLFGTAINLVLTSLGAYALSRKNVMLGRPIMLAIVFTMFFHGGIIPMYLVVNNIMHLGNSLLALMLPVAISTWNLIIMRTSFEQVPEGLIESARIDGANEFVILIKIVVPVSLPVISVMILFYGVQHWNSWFNAMIFLRDRDLFPLQLILREIVIQNSLDDVTAGVDDVGAIAESIKYAAIVVATLPILLIYPLLQKYFVKGVMIGAIKG